MPAGGHVMTFFPAEESSQKCEPRMANILLWGVEICVRSTHEQQRQEAETRPWDILVDSCATRY